MEPVIFMFQAVRRAVNVLSISTCIINNEINTIQ